MEGKSLPIHFTGLSTGSQIFTSFKNDVHVSRSLTRLKAIFVSMFKLNPAGATFRGSQAVRSFWQPMEGTSDFDEI